MAAVTMYRWGALTTVVERNASPKVKVDVGLGTQNGRVFG